MLQFQPMSDEEFLAFKSWIIEDYASDIAENYRVSIDEARTAAEKDINGMLSQGLASPNQSLNHIVVTDGEQADKIGYLWIDVDLQKKRCFISEIYLFSQYRHQGWGRKTLELLDEKMKEAGIQRIGLHVFGNNQVAQNLYRKQGFVTTGIQMQKWIGDPPVAGE